LRWWQRCETIGRWRAKTPNPIHLKFAEFPFHGQKKQRGWEYMRKLGNSPKVPRPAHKKAHKHEQEAFKKSSL
jgi:hypothetical protein